MSSLATYQYQPAYHDEGKPVNQATQTSNTSRSDGRQRNDFREPGMDLCTFTKTYTEKVVYPFGLYVQCYNWE